MNRLVGISVLVCLLQACGQEAAQPPSAPLSVVEILGGASSEGYERAWQPQPLVWPVDHGAHDGFKNEWWYFTGNLSDAEGRAFGYQFTLFRSAIAPQKPATDSAWSSNQIYLAHAALSDIDGQYFLYDERFSRGAMGLSGAQGEPLRFWLEDWSVSGGTDLGHFTVTIRVRAEGFTLDLALDSTKPMVLHGDRGLSAKGHTPGNASYYYSFTRLRTEGAVQFGGETFQVQGESWFDHEWSTSSLEPGQTGWDWFSLQLSDQSELMLFRLRHASDPGQDYSSGTLIGADGSVSPLQGDEFSIKVLDQWQNPASGVRYPSGWTLRVPAQDLELRVIPLQEDQEIRASFRYWEGAADVSGSSNGASVTGRGYVELTGYQ